SRRVHRSPAGDLCGFSRVIFGSERGRSPPMSRPPVRSLQIVLRVFAVVLAVGGVFMILASKPLIARVFLRPPESEVSTLLLFVLKDMGVVVLMLTLMLFFASRDPVSNAAMVDALIAILVILPITQFLSLHT